jgi:hypothetical protein
VKPIAPVNDKKIKPIVKSQNADDSDDLWFDFADAAVQDHREIPTAIASIELDVQIIDTAEKLSQLIQKLEKVKPRCCLGHRD